MSPIHVYLLITTPVIKILIILKEENKISKPNQISYLKNISLHTFIDENPQLKILYEHFSFLVAFLSILRFEHDTSSLPYKRSEIKFFYTLAANTIYMCIVCVYANYVQQ